MSSLQKPFLDLLRKRFPELNAEESLVSENLLSPFKVQISKQTLSTVQAFVRTVFKMRTGTAYQDFYKPEMTERGLIDPGNHSILMSYDFHLDEGGQPKLIEINTNASFLALSNFMYELHGMPSPIADFEIDELRSDILEELELFGQPNTRPEVVIMDEKPSEQRLYIEFLVYQELMKEWGFPVAIKDIDEIEGTEDFIYNRYTDFYLQEDKSKSLKNLFQKKQICFSPQPYEYLLLADKQRMVDWWSPGFLDKMNLSDREKELIRQVSLRSEILKTDTAEACWGRRKSLFFKPLRSFGAKQSFRGATISRKTFEDLLGHETLAQEYVPAPVKDFKTNTGTEQFKFDLRFYVYKGRVQSGLARLYQGQVTNLKTPMGGFAPLEIIDI